MIELFLFLLFAFVFIFGFVFLFNVIIFGEYFPFVKDYTDDRLKKKKEAYSEVQKAFRNRSASQIEYALITYKKYLTDEQIAYIKSRQVDFYLEEEDDKCQSKKIVGTVGLV